jgi:hypothetical protein
MRAYVVFAVLLLVARLAAPADAATVPYLGNQVEVTGVVQPGATPDHIRVADQSGDVFDVIVNRDSTFVSSRSLLRAQQVVRVDGQLVSGRDGTGQTITAEEISSGLVDLASGAKPHSKAWSIALGAAAGVLLGSGVYVFRRSIFGQQGAAAAPAGTSLSSGVQFGGGP